MKEHIVYIREVLGLPVPIVANAIGISMFELADIENGKNNDQDIIRKLELYYQDQFDHTRELVDKEFYSHLVAYLELKDGLVGEDKPDFYGMPTAEMTHKELKRKLKQGINKVTE